jgi:hypothetical protein
VGCSPAPKRCRCHGAADNIFVKCFTQRRCQEARPVKRGRLQISNYRDGRCFEIGIIVSLLGSVSCKAHEKAIHINSAMMILYFLIKFVVFSAVEECKVFRLDQSQLFASPRECLTTNLCYKSIYPEYTPTRGFTIPRYSYMLCHLLISGRFAFILLHKQRCPPSEDGRGIFSRIIPFLYKNSPKFLR